MCTALMQSIRGQQDDKKAKDVPKTAAEVPLGDGLAEAAKMSILARRRQIEAAVEAGEPTR